MKYIKQYHDNIRCVNRSKELYDLDQLDHELSVITSHILDSLTDHNGDYFINQVINDYRVLLENEDDLSSDECDALMDEYYWKIMYELMKILKTRGRINGGDYDIIMKGDD